MNWQERIIEIIVDAEKSLPVKHLISLNISNGSQKIDKPHPAVSVFNFHYSTPPDSVGMNYGLNKVIGDNETGFKGVDDDAYRMEGWDFILAGGALYNNLDYSFATGAEDGSFQYPKTQPGGGGASLRKQLRVLRDFIDGFDFVRMKPDNGVLVSGTPGGKTVRALVEPGKAYAVYLRPAPPQSTETALTIDLPPGTYRAEWIEPASGRVIKHEVLNHSGGAHKLNAPPSKDDLALRIRR
jgi:hypothetical protein